MDSKIDLFIIVAGIFAAIPKMVVGDAAVMSHVTAHFGKALEQCREEVNI